MESPYNVLTCSRVFFNINLTLSIETVELVCTGGKKAIESEHCGNVLRDLSNWSTVSFVV